MSLRKARGGSVSWHLFLFWLLVWPCLTSCSGPAINFSYPSEQVDFSLAGYKMPDLYFGLIRDLRPADQKSGQGHFVGITFPGDDSWEIPVTQVFRKALTQDILETHLVDLVPLAGQASYSLEADILSFGCRLQRCVVSFVLPLAVGMGGGMAWGHDSSDRLKRGAVLGAATLIFAPVPASFRAEAEVRLRLRDQQGEVIWERTCLGEVDTTVWDPATSRYDQKYVDQFLAKALKRCNGCLLGQLRQELLTRGG